jgi:hypothetical protein
MPTKMLYRKQLGAQLFASKVPDVEGFELGKAGRLRSGEPPCASGPFLLANQRKEKKPPPTGTRAKKHSMAGEKLLL